MRLPRGGVRGGLACREALAQRLPGAHRGRNRGELQVSPEDVAVRWPRSARGVAGRAPPGAGRRAPLAQRLPADGGEERLVENAPSAALAQLAD